ncbi:hypothetical protein [Segatella paludivivens]|nr:hypothetical protein [Segatella paludivivens]
MKLLLVMSQIINELTNIGTLLGCLAQRTWDTITLKTAQKNI